MSRGTGEPGNRGRNAAGAVHFGLASGIALAAALAAAGGDAGQALAGWSLALANGLAGWAIDLRAVRWKGERSVLLSLAAHAVRALGLLLVVVVVRLKFGAGCEGFVAAALAAYFVFLFGEVARLARARV